MKSTALVLCALVAAPVRLSAASFEALRAGSVLSPAAAEASRILSGESAPSPVPDGAPLAAPSPAPAENEPILERPELFDVPADRGVGGLIGEFRLADRLDSHRDMYTLRLGALDWDVSMASDAEFKVQYFTFRRGEDLVLSRINDLNDLRGSGVVVKLDEETSYRFKVSINIFNPVRRSSLKIDPVNGTRGPKHKLKTGKILDAAKRESFVFKAGGREFWLLYGTDVDPATDAPAETRTFLFINERGMKTKAYPVAENKLKPGLPVEVSLGGTRVVLIKTLSDELRIHAPAGGAVLSRA